MDSDLGHGQRNGVKTPEEYNVRCCLCSTWRAVTVDDYEYYSDRDVPFVCRSVGLRCRRPDDTEAEPEDAE